MTAAVWWGRPADPANWFSSEQLAAARRYHRPLAWAALLRTLAQASGLILVWWWARSFADSSPTSFATVAAATTLAVWSPVAAVEAWSAYRHEPRFGAPRIDPARFASSTVMVGVLALSASVPLALAFRWLVLTTRWWPVPAVLALVAGSALIGTRLAPALHRFDPLPSQVAEELSLLAASAGVVDVRFGQLDRDSHERGLNAMAFGLGGRGLVLCTEGLLSADPELRDFVVAHELAHLRRRHHRWALVVCGLGSGVELGALWGASTFGPTGRWLDLSDAESLPTSIALLGLVSLATGAFEAWVSRANERRADADALASAEPGESSLRELVQQDRSDLEPTALARWFAPHPSPAQRLVHLRHSAVRS